jgi:hypothetical protein
MNARQRAAVVVRCPWRDLGVEDNVDADGHPPDERGRGYSKSYSNNYDSECGGGGVAEARPPAGRLDGEGGSLCTTTRPPRRSVGRGRVVVQSSPEGSILPAGGREVVTEVGWGQPTDLVAVVVGTKSGRGADHDPAVAVRICLGGAR